MIVRQSILMRLSRKVVARLYGRFVIAIAPSYDVSHAVTISEQPRSRCRSTSVAEVPVRHRRVW